MCLKILYKTLYGSKFEDHPINKYSNAMENLTFSIFESKDAIQLDQENISSLATHERYPLIFAASRSGDILVIWTQTMQVISVLTGVKHPIVKIQLSPSGDRVVAIDSNSNIDIWRFNLLSRKIKKQVTIKSRTIYDISFINDSSMFVVLTKDNLVLFDLLTYNLDSPEVICEIQANSLFYLPAHQLCLAINLKRKKLMTVDISNRQLRNENSFDSSVGEFTICIINKLGTVLCVGTSEGEVLLVDSKTLEQIILYRPFDRDQIGRPC